MDAATLRAAMQETYVSDAVLAQYLPYFLDAMKAAEITTVQRAAAWCSQIGHESAGLKYMAEIQTSDPSWSADRTRYRGRGPIQLTWSSNYRKFGQWCKANGYVDNSELFVTQPELVEQPKWGFLAASWYWLKAGPRPGQINGYADVGDILAVSCCINGWVEGKEPNGYADRKARWNRCLAMGSAILPDQNGATMPDYGITKVMHGYNPDTGDDCTGNSDGPRAQTLYAVVHTQESDGTAVNLANFVNSTRDRSYNMAVDAVDTVEIVPAIEGPWAAMESNAIGFHLCFAGSRASWTRDQWLAQSAMLRRGAKAIAAACQQFNIPAVKVLSTGGWPVTPKGIAGHVDFGQRGGGHTDPGPNFPWPEFVDMVKAELAPTTPQPPAGGPQPVRVGPADDQLEFRWNCLGGQTVVEALAEVRDKVLGTNDRIKTGVVTQ